MKKDNTKVLSKKSTYTAKSVGEGIMIAENCEYNYARLTDLVNQGLVAKKHKRPENFKKLAANGLAIKIGKSEISTLNSTPEKFVRLTGDSLAALSEGEASVSFWSAHVKQASQLIKAVGVKQSPNESVKRQGTSVSPAPIVKQLIKTIAKEKLDKNGHIQQVEWLNQSTKKAAKQVGGDGSGVEKHRDEKTSPRRENKVLVNQDNRGKNSIFTGGDKESLQIRGTGQRDKVAAHGLCGNGPTQNEIGKETPYVVKKQTLTNVKPQNKTTNPPQDKSAHSQVPLGNNNLSNELPEKGDNVVPVAPPVLEDVDGNTDSQGGGKGVNVQPHVDQSGAGGGQAEVLGKSSRNWQRATIVFFVAIMLIIAIPNFVRLIGFYAYAGGWQSVFKGLAIFLLEFAPFMALGKAGVKGWGVFGLIFMIGISLSLSFIVGMHQGVSSNMGMPYCLSFWKAFGLAFLAEGALTIAAGFLAHQLFCSDWQGNGKLEENK